MAVFVDMRLVNTPPRAPQSFAAVQKLFNTDTLNFYNGERGAPLYLSILGEVFDVSKGKQYYGEHCFALLALHFALPSFPLHYQVGKKPKACTGQPQTITNT